MSLYNADGQINTTVVDGSSYTGLYAADGSWNIVINDGSTYKGLYHPCGAFNAVVVTDPFSSTYASNGSINVIANAFGGYSPVNPLGGANGPLVWRQVGNNSLFPTTFSSSFKQLNNSTPHWVHDDIVSLVVVYANSYGLSESNPGPATLSLGVKYNGVVTEFKFGGSSVASDPFGGGLFITDELPISIARDSRIDLQPFYQGTNGIIYYSLAFADSEFLGESFASGATDRHLIGGIPTTSPNVLLPMLILARTRNNAIGVISDSIGNGTFCGATGATKDIGVFNVCLGPSMGITNVAAPGEVVSGLYSRFSLRKFALQFITHAIVLEGDNDIANGGTGSQLYTDLQVLPTWPELVGKDLSVCTMPPRTNSSNVAVSSEAQRVDGNTRIRAGVPGYRRVLELADPLEGGRNLGTWGNLSWTNEGVHLVIAGENVVVASGNIVPSTFNTPLVRGVYGPPPANPAPLVDPTQLSNLAAWFEPGRGGMFQSNAGTTSAAANNDLVGYLPDLSGNGFHINSLADDTTRPVLAGVGAKPYLVFDKTKSTILKRAASLGDYAAGGASWFAVLASTAGAASNYFGGERDSASSNSLYSPFNMLSATDTSAFIRNGSNTTLFVNGTTVKASAFPSSSTVVVYGVVDDGASLTPYVNGVAGTPRSYTRSGTLTLNRFGLGGLWGSTPGSYMSMNLYGATFYSRALTAAEAYRLSAYLAGLR